MTRDCLNTHIRSLQCKHGEYTADFINKLKIGKICITQEQNVVIVRKYIKQLYCYKPFEDDVTYAYSFTIGLAEDTANISITVGSTNITYSGNADLDLILESLKQDFLADSTYSFEALIINDKLWIYSYDNTLSFSTSTTATINSNNTITATNEQADYCIILNYLNCLTTEELCNIIEHSNSLMDDCNC